MILAPGINPDTVPVIDPGVASFANMLLTSYPFNLTDAFCSAFVEGPATLTRTLFPLLTNSGSGVLRL
jgi:hypothetical protein